MPPPEKPIDPGKPFASFANGLRALRLKRDITYRHMARLTHFGKSVLHEAAGGEKLPTLEVTIAFVEVCEGSKDEWIAVWYREHARCHRGGGVCG